MITVDSKVKVYVDAAHMPYTTSGTWAAVFVDDEIITRIECGKLPRDQQLLDEMQDTGEVYAIANALKFYNPDAVVDLYTDSTAAIRAATGDKQDHWASVEKLKTVISEKKLVVNFNHIHRATNIYQSYADHYARMVNQSRKPYSFGRYIYTRKQGSKTK